MMANPLIFHDRGSINYINLNAKQEFGHKKIDIEMACNLHFDIIFI